MGAALELIVLPVILITLLVLLLLKASLGAATIFASAVVLGLLYFVVIKLLRQLQRSDLAAEAEDRAEVKRVEQAAREAARLSQRAATLGEAVKQFRLKQGTAEEARQMTERAVRHFEQKGKAALADLTEPGGAFIDRDLYVFVIDREGNYHAFGGMPERVGTRMQDVPGIDGAELVRKILEVIEVGGGWVEYDFRNPTTGQMAPKMSYILERGGLCFGCGIYKSLA